MTVSSMARSVLLWREDATEKLFRKFMEEELKNVVAEVKSGKLKLSVPDESVAVRKLLEQDYFVDYKGEKAAKKAKRELKTEA